MTSAEVVVRDGRLGTGWARSCSTEGCYLAFSLSSRASLALTSGLSPSMTLS